MGFGNNSNEHFSVAKTIVSTFGAVYLWVVTIDNISQYSIINGSFSFLRISSSIPSSIIFSGLGVFNISIWSIDCIKLSGLSILNISIPSIGCSTFSGLSIPLINITSILSFSGLHLRDVPSNPIGSIYTTSLSGFGVFNISIWSKYSISFSGLGADSI